MAVLLAVAVAVAAAQRAPLRSSIELTVVTATVRDADGKLVTGLPKEAFEVYEDGVRLPIAQFTNERVPLGLGLLLDISDSMFGRRIKDAEAAVERFLRHAARRRGTRSSSWRSTTKRGCSSGGRRTRPASTTRSRSCSRRAAPRSTTPWSRALPFIDRPPARTRGDRPHHRRRRYGERHDAARPPAGAGAQRRLRLRHRHRHAGAAGDRQARERGDAQRDHRPERRPHRGRAQHRGPRAAPRRASPRS